MCHVHFVFLKHTSIPTDQKTLVTITLPAASPAVIVLSKLDERYFRPISGASDWTFDFLVFRKGETRPVTTSSSSIPYSRSVNAEVHLEAGEYVLHASHLYAAFVHPSLIVSLRFA